MKKLLSRIFFLDAPAQGVFFFLTLLFTLPWFLLVWLFHCSRVPLSLFVFATEGGRVGTAYAFIVPLCMVLLFCADALFLCLRLLPELWRVVKKRRFAPLLYGVGAVLALCGGVFVLMKLLVNLFKCLSLFFPFWNMPPEMGFVQQLGWGWFALIGLVLLLGAYLLMGKTISLLWQTSFKVLFGKGVLVLWGLVLVSYLCSLVLAFQAASRYHRSIEELAEYFGHPMTASGFADVYYNGRTPDAAYWKKVSELTRKKNGLFNATFCGKPVRIESFLNPNEQVDEEFLSKWKAYFIGNESIRQLEAMLDEPLPLPERNYSDEKLLASLPLNELPFIRELARMERWRQRIAMEADDTAAVQMAWRRLENICAYMQNEPFLMGSLVWLAVEHMRLASLERLVPWEKTESAWLEAQAAKLAEMEETVKQVQQSAVYGEAVFAINAINLICNDGEKRSNPCVLRWFLPQVWRMLANDAAEALKAYKISDFADFPEKRGDSFMMYMLSDALRHAGTHKFPAFVANLRIMRSLIDAELQKRRTGHYPDQLDTLQDPFSKQPLKYKKGQIELRITKLIPRKEDIEWWLSGDTADSKNTDAFDDSFGGDSIKEPPILQFKAEDESKTLEGIQVWSVGPDCIDNGGTLDKLIDGSWKRYDDLRYFIPLR